MTQTLCVDEPVDLDDWVELHPVSEPPTRRLKLLRDPVEVVTVEDADQVPAQTYEGDVEVI